MVKETFEELVKYKAKRMADGPSLKEQASKLGFSGENEIKAFKVGAWDAMIYDMALSISQAYARRDYRRRLIQKWLKEGM